ncbi:hypothetical protein H9Q72_005646 [Fusarium xylarioides]|uniref:Uncharacterized protein n=1 Tax=Fusarium xylarioides TaxID=221167 RepID=A0A9P7HZ72_9HYPO|nr:hypothetical protein H9Q72_005646 [Fusarium xylarioides]
MRGRRLDSLEMVSSGIQIPPAITDQVGKLVTFIREAAWVATRPGGDYQAYSIRIQERLRNENLEKFLTPKWPVGCWKLTPGTNYLESL